jgi:hypothetical protein
MSGDASISAAGAVTVAKGLAMTNGASLINIPASGVAGEAVVKTTVFAGNVTGIWNNLIIPAGSIVSSMINPAITNALVAGGVLPAVDGSAVTNIAGGNIASGNIAAARIATALGTSGGSIGGNIPIATLTNALSATLYTGVITNASTLITNKVTVVNGVIASVATTLP